MQVLLGSLKDSIISLAMSLLFILFSILPHFHHTQTHKQAVHMDLMGNNEHRFLCLCLFDTFVCILPWNQSNAAAYDDMNV